MTIPDAPPSVQEQVIEQRLVECGLSRAGFKVRYQDDLQSIEILITSASGARTEHFPCIRQAVEQEIVSFADGSMQKAYSDYEAEILRPQILESATAEVKKRGLLKGFPDRRSFASLELYAQALERHSGLGPGSALSVSHQKIIFNPPEAQTNLTNFDERYTGLLAAIMFAMARGDFKGFGFIGNEAVADTEGK